MGWGNFSIPDVKDDTPTSQECVGEILERVRAL